jgi:hypothetical protein
VRLGDIGFFKHLVDTCVVVSLEIEQSFCGVQNSICYDLTSELSDMVGTMELQLPNVFFRFSSIAVPDIIKDIGEVDIRRCVNQRHHSSPCVRKFYENEYSRYGIILRCSS